MVEIRKMLAPVVKSGARSGKNRAGFAGVTIHNTGNTGKGAGAANHGAYLQGNGKNKQASWHYAVDGNLITQSIPENEVAWHAGDGGGKGNMQTVAIEICMNPECNLRMATDNAAELTAYILKRNGISKAQARKYVYQHNNWSGKNCPQLIRGGVPYGWEEFLRKVEINMEEKKKVHWGEKHLDSLVKKGLINTPEAHRNSLDETLTKAQVFAMLDRVTDSK